MMKRYLIFLALMPMAFIYIAGCAMFFPPKGDRYYFPELYRGWVCVHYNVEGTPQLTVEDGYLVHKIPENGLLVTSSAPRLIAPVRDEYYYYTNKGVRKAKEIEHGGGYTKQQKLKKEIKIYFWISCCGYLESDYDKYIKNRIDIDKDPECGRWN